ncbi:MAG TPA: trehalose-6-phosphate synthase, partial [Vicinamibacterales bacterium]|nr:trehalose-6-phosphate synthase [Vicinamibacterales bacterium]
MQATLDTYWAGTPVVVLANRAPFRCHVSDDGVLRVQRSAGGLVTAVEPIVAACSGTWVAHGDANAGTAGANAVAAPEMLPANTRYRLRHVHLTKEEHHGFYAGFANEALWPLCHAVHVKPVFRISDFRYYRIANQRFADVTTQEALGSRPLVLVQDYHFALAPRMLRKRLPASTVAVFWHIPWPHARVFATCPWKQELLDGLLASDVVGVQTAEDRENFLDSVESCLGAHVDRTSGMVWYRDQRTLVRDYPVGIEWDSDVARTEPSADTCRVRVRRELNLGADVRLGVGVDRLDYTKGIEEKFLAVERLLETRPEFRGRFVFVQVAEPSRDSLSAYRAARAQIVATSERVNARFASGSWRPIVLLETHHEPAEVYRLYRAADVCYVNSLHDGMNLVAKEFVRGRDDERGVLVLSQFAGASQQLRAALIVNPYAVDESANALARALDMSAAEQTARMRQMREVVRRTDTYWWAEQLLRDAKRMSTGTSNVRSHDSQFVAGLAMPAPATFRRIRYNV